MQQVKLSLKSESVLAIWIDVHPVGDQNPDTHDIHASTDRPRIATFHDDTIRSVRVPPLCSGCLPHDIVPWSYPWVARTLSQISSLEEMVRYRPIATIIELLQFTGSHIPACGQYYLILAQQGENDMVLDWHRRRLPPWCLEYTFSTSGPSHPMILYFPLVAPSVLKLNQLALPNLQPYISSIQLFPQTTRG
jgi:hypothetical protein